MRILMIVEASFAGVGRHTLDLAEQLVHLGQVVDIAYSTTRADSVFVERLARIDHHRTIEFKARRSIGFADIRAMFTLRTELRKNGPYDIIHGHSSKGGAYARLLRPRGGIVVYTPHALITQSPDLSGLTKRIYSLLERLLSTRTDLLICVSDSELAHTKTLRLRPRAGHVVFNGIALVDLPTRAQARRTLGLAENGLCIGFVGRLDSQKGLDVLLEAMSTVIARFPKVELVVIGTGDLADQLLEQASSLGLTANVRWLGQQKGQDAMPAFDVFALPSRYEGFPYVALEALWAGVPAVVTEQAGCDNLLADGKAGRIVQRNAAGLSSALVEILSDVTLRAGMARHGRAISEQFSVANMAKSTLDLYADQRQSRGEEGSTSRTTST
jgi:glycosyltransferase involved in cell wall biosynthesis